MNRWVLLVVLVVGTTTARPAAAQTGAVPDLALRGVPAGEATAGPLSLTLADAIARGLSQNLAAIAAESRVQDASGDRLGALSDLLPTVAGSVRQSTHVVNLAEFGFTGFPGVPDVIGPFSVFDARLSVSAPLLDFERLNELHASSADLDAARFSRESTRDTLILVIGSLYLEAVTGEARVEAAESDVETAITLLQYAEDQHDAGVVAGIDVLRQRAQLQAATARRIDATNAFEKDKLRLARAIGLAADQVFELASHPPYAPAPALDEEAAMATAFEHRDDLRAAEARLEAARATARAAHAAHLPSLHLDANYGRLGSEASSTESTYAVAASVHVPIFDGGSTRARSVQAGAEVDQRAAELADFRAGVRFDVRAALLDVTAADARVHVAEARRDLVRQELAQAEDRFRAGVSSSIELAQAQDAVSSAAEQYIAGVQAHILAKVSLARAMGQVEERFLALVGGQP